MNKPRSSRISKKQLERAAEIAKAQGVRVTVGKFTFEPAGENAANDVDDEEARRIQAQIDAMGRGR